LHRTFLALAVMTLCAATQLIAQTANPRPKPALEGFLAPNGHPRPAPANAPRVPEVVFDAGNLGSPLILDKGWRVGITADSSVASPSFDDSTWAIRDAQDFFADVPDQDHHDEPDANADSGANGNPGRPPGHHRPFVWFRLHLKLAPNHGPLALLVELPISQNVQMGASSLGLDVFANGKQIQPEGPHREAPERFQAISRLYKLDVPPSETSLTLVVRRIYIPFGPGTYTGFFSNHKLRLGTPDDLDRSLEIWSVHSLFERLPRLIDNILLTVLSLFLLALFFTQKGHVEYLWLALYELLQAPIGFVELAGSSALLDNLVYIAIFAQLLAISAYLYFEFLVAFLSLRKRWYIHLLRFTAPVLVFVAPSVLLVGHSSAAPIFLILVFGLSIFWIIGWFLFIFLTLIAATIRRNFEAGLLLIPLLLTLVGIAEPILTTSMNDWAGRPFHSLLTFHAGPIPIHFASIADFTGILAIVLIIFGRFLRIQRDQERASSELAAARSVQELMIPQEKIKTPGFEVDTIYDPANEVGGDFFHVQPLPNGALLVVVGDVAGKGLKAAMNVSMLMGALRSISDLDPAEILQSLNRVLVGSESFTTCQAALFKADGELVVANAGHLPPYLNSQEVALPGGLPLGVLPEVSYEEVRLYLHPGDRVLLLSDGVVEARKPSGELFGFDRVHNLSNQTATYIADAAKAFGQDDDITVLTVRRLAEAMAA
jgi:phosphoserine phosphatase RsbU/P